MAVQAVPAKAYWARDRPMWLTLLAVRNAIAVLMASLAIVVLGATSLSRLSMDLFPNINQPVERSAPSTPGPTSRTSRRRSPTPSRRRSAGPGAPRRVAQPAGISAVQVWFNYDADLNAGQNEIIQRIQQISNTLPSGIKQPFIVKFDLSNIPVCLITVSGGGLDEKRLYDLAYNTIEPQIERITGSPPPTSTAARSGRSPSTWTGPPVREGDLGPGRRAVGQRCELPHAVGRHQDRHRRLQAAHEQPVPAREADGGHRRPEGRRRPVRVRDLGYVSDSHEAQSSVVRVNGERAVYLRVNKQPAANTIEVVDAVKAMPKLIGCRAGVSVGLTFDQSTYIRQSINSLWHESLQGARRWRSWSCCSSGASSRRASSSWRSRSIMCTLIAMYFP